MKKILLTLAAVVAVTAGVVGLSAFEAHIINVTAHIENALKVDTTPIAFGTVFPQEYLERGLKIDLSDSFMREDRVDDVKYVINQKLKPCPLKLDVEGKPIQPLTPIDPTCVADTADATPHNPTGFHYLNLCPYLSKVNIEQDEDEGTGENDVDHPSYYIPAAGGTAASCQTVTIPASGMLTKLANDTSDAWIVDLKVPPVAGNVGQDWPVGCPTVENNDKTYGCDLWIEVTDISEKPT